MEFYPSMAWKVTFFVIFLCALKPGLGNHQNSSFAMSSSSIRVNTLNRLYPVISLTSGVYVTTVLDNLRTFVLDGGESSDVTSAVSITSDIISLSLKSTVTIEASVPGAVHTCLSKNLFSSSEIVLTPSATPRRTPNRRNTITVDYKLILCVIVPLFSILAFVIVLTVLLCIRRYRKLRRYRQHLVPLTDMDASDDSDEDDQIIDDEEPVFMVSSVNSSARPVLSFENDND